MHECANEIEITSLEFLYLIVWICVFNWDWDNIPRVFILINVWVCNLDWDNSLEFLYLIVWVCNWDWDNVPRVFINLFLFEYKLANCCWYVRNLERGYRDNFEFHWFLRNRIGFEIILKQWYKNLKLMLFFPFFESFCFIHSGHNFIPFESGRVVEYKSMFHRNSKLLLVFEL